MVGRRRHWVTAFVITAMLASGLAAVDAPPAAASVPAPATSDPETSTPSERVSSPTTICLGAGHRNLINSKIAVDPADRAGLDALQGDAEEVVTDLHGWDPKDSRIWAWGQPDVWRAMFDGLLSIINKNPAARTA